MKKILTKIVEYIKKIVLFFFNIFFNAKSKKKEKNMQNNLPHQENLEKKNETIFRNTQESDSIAGSQRELHKENIQLKKQDLLNQEIIKIEFYKLIEKTFKLKIKDLPIENKKKLEEYTAKTIIVKVKEKMQENKIEKKEDLEKVLKEQLKKDIKKQEVNFEVLSKNPELYIYKENRLLKRENFTNKILEIQSNEPSKETKMQPLKEEQENTDNRLFIQDLESYTRNTMPLLKSSTLVTENKKTEGVEPKEEKASEKTNSTMVTVSLENRIEMEEKKREETIQDPIVENTFLKEELEIINLHETPLNTLVPATDEIKQESIPEEKEKVNEKDNEKQINLLSKEEKELEKKEQVKPKEEEEKKEEKLQNLQIDISQLEIENNRIIEEAQKEYQKENLIDKEYGRIEKALGEKIAKLDDLLQMPLSNEQKIKITNELEKLKKAQKQVALHKENDLETLRITLEEIIPLEEIELINLKLKELTDNEELKRKEFLFKNIENKSKQELENIEQLMIKETFKKTVRRLEIPLFLSFPFIKNKHFRRLVGGLFIFRSFGFIKNILFGTTNPLDAIDLSYIQRGSDALSESICITETNIASFEELKTAALTKYPQLKTDIEFLNDLNKIEENLYKNYEKLLKQDKVVKKYFNKSKVLLRKRKKRFF